MKVKAITFTGKTPKPTQIKKLSEKTLSEIFCQSDKDYIALSKKTKSKEDPALSDFIENAKKFFSDTFGL